MPMSPMIMMRSWWWPRARNFRIKITKDFILICVRWHFVCICKVPSNEKKKNNSIHSLSVHSTNPNSFNLFYIIIYKAIFNLTKKLHKIDIIKWSAQSWCSFFCSKNNKHFTKLLIFVHTKQFRPSRFACTIITALMKLKLSTRCRLQN